MNDFSYCFIYLSPQKESNIMEDLGICAFSCKSLPRSHLGFMCSLSCCSSICSGSSPCSSAGVDLYFHYSPPPISKTCLAVKKKVTLERTFAKSSKLPHSFQAFINLYKFLVFLKRNVKKTFNNTIIIFL